MAKTKEVPPGVPLGDTGAPQQGEPTKPPPFGTGRPVADKGALPRLINGLDRAVPGTVRYKVRCNNFHPMGRQVYILAKPGDESGARSLYLKERGIAREIERLKKLNVPNILEPDLVVTELPD